MRIIKRELNYQTKTYNFRRRTRPESAGEGWERIKRVKLKLTMHHKLNKEISKKKTNIVYAFIDSQNLNLGISKDIYKNSKRIYAGWQLDYKRFYRYLIDKFRVQKTFLFIGYIKKNQRLYDALKFFGYHLIFKPTVKDSQGKPKGNVDAELVLYAAAIEYPKYDKAVIVSGDGDFYCLHKYLKANGKLCNILIPNRKSESSLLKNFQKYKIFLDREKEKLEYK